MSSENIYPRNRKEYDGPRVTDIHTFKQALLFVWGNTYELDSSAVYTTTASHLSFTCKFHGEFRMTPNNILNGKGCRQCGRERTKQSQRLPEEEVNRRVREKFGDLYEIDFSGYENSSSIVRVYCKKHDVYHDRKISSLTIKRYPACRICDHENSLKDIDDVLNDFRKTHPNNRYDYRLVEYKGTKEKVPIICHSHHEPHIFMMTPNSHLFGKGCPLCNTGQYTTDNIPEDISTQPATLYLIRIFNEGVSFIKFGITRQTVKGRMRNLKKDGFDFEILKEVSGTMAEVVEREEHIKKYVESIGEDHKQHQLKGSKTNGWTECVSESVDLFSFFY